MWYAINWYIWCQKYKHNLKKERFHLGVALNQAWQIIVQVAIGKAVEIQILKRHGEIDSKFMAT